MKRLLLLALLPCLAFTGIAQQNPFEEFGYTPKIATLSGGKYIEYFDRDTIVQIGSIVYNTKSKKVIGFVEEDTAYSESTLQPDIVSRWISPDPMAYMAPGWTPYRFAYNNPIYWTDPTGLLESPIYDESGEFLGTDDEGFSGDVLVMSSEDFKQGMSHKEATEKGTSFDKANLSNSAKGQVLSHISNSNLGDGLDLSSDVNISFTGDKNYLWTARDATKENVNIKAGDYQSYYETTVENVRNVVNLHEVKGHVFGGISGGLSDHYRAMNMQLDHSSFSSTTPKFQAYTLALTYFSTPNPNKNFLSVPKYNNLFYNNGGYEAYDHYFIRKAHLND